MWLNKTIREQRRRYDTIRYPLERCTPSPPISLPCLLHYHRGCPLTVCECALSPCADDGTGASDGTAVNAAAKGPPANTTTTTT